MEKADAEFISKQVSAGEYYYLNLTPSKTDKAVVVCGGREQCGQEYRIKRNGFRFQCIEFVSAGSGKLTIEGRSYVLRPGAIFSYGPGVAHIIESDAEHPMIKHFVDFSGIDLENLTARTVFGAKSLFFVSCPFIIRSVFENLIRVGNSESRNRDELCVLLLRQLILHADESAIDPESSQSAARHTYLRCRQHIESSYLHICNIGEAAEKCFVDRAYLSRLFKRFAEESPQQLLTRLKMGYAADLLVNSDLLIKQIGEKAGYSDPYHFSRVFKRVYGIPPAVFMKTARRNSQT